jgi:hypothetical protein
LSWEARGILAYLLSKPDGWVCRNYDLENNGPAGRDKIKRILKELKEFGYMVRDRQRKADGTFDYVTAVYEVAVDVKSVDGSAVDGKDDHIVSIDIANTDYQNTIPSEKFDKSNHTQIAVYEDEFLVELTPEKVNAILRAAGYDPDEVGDRTQKVADLALKAQEMGLDDYFGPKQTPVEGLKRNPSEEQRELRALGVREDREENRYVAMVRNAGWEIRHSEIELGVAHFLSATGFEVPADKNLRNLWILGVQEHIGQYPLDELKKLYAQAWAEYEEAVFEGELDITHPRALSKKMYAIRQRPEEELPDYKIMLSRLMGAGEIDGSICETQVTFTWANNCEVVSEEEVIRRYKELMRVYMQGFL